MREIKVSIEKELMMCPRCHGLFTVLNLFNKKWVCMKCYNDLKTLSDEYDYAKTRLLK